MRDSQKQLTTQGENRHRQSNVVKGTNMNIAIEIIKVWGLYNLIALSTIFVAIPFVKPPKGAIRKTVALVESISFIVTTLVVLLI